MKRCLHCYQFLTENTSQINGDFHEKCSKKIFGQFVIPELSFNEDELDQLATSIIRSQTVVTGVQAKLSLAFDRKPSQAQPARFTVVGLWGGYILKPATPLYPQLPEVEDLTMHLAKIAKIKTVVRQSQSDRDVLRLVSHQPPLGD